MLPIQPAFRAAFGLVSGMRRDMFNVTNSVRFDAQSISSTLDNPQSFGQATSLLTNYRPAQCAARVAF
jgi:hypothetical protein